MSERQREREREMPETERERERCQKERIMYMLGRDTHVPERETPCQRETHKHVREREAYEKVVNSPPGFRV
jgi:hypothetical protein